MERKLALLAVIAACNGSPSKLDEIDRAPAGHAVVEPAPASHAPASPPPPAIDAAIAASKASGKPLVVEFSTTWCHPCQIFASTTLVNARVQKALGAVEFIHYDAEATPGDDAAKRYHVSSFPTFLAVDKDGVAQATSSGIVTGEPGVEQFLDFLAKAKDVTVDEPAVLAQIAAAPDDAGARLTAARFYLRHDRGADADAQLAAAIASAKATDAQRGEAKLASARIHRLARWKRERIAEEIDRARLAPETVQPHDLELATVDSGATPAELHDVFTKVFSVRRTPNALNDVIYIALAAGDAADALAAAKAVLGGTDDPSILDSLAECYHATGDRSAAEITEDHAIALAGSGAFARSLGENRTRFAAGDAPSPELAAIHARVAATWTRLAHVDDEPATDAIAAAAAAVAAPASPPDATAASQAFKAVFDLGQTIATACADRAGSATGAFARIELDPAGKITSSTIFLDAGGSESLRACIAEQLAAATVPVVGGMELPTVRIRFGPHRPTVW